MEDEEEALIASVSQLYCELLVNTALASSRVSETTEADMESEPEPEPEPEPELAPEVAALLTTHDTNDDGVLASAELLLLAQDADATANKAQLYELEELRSKELQDEVLGLQQKLAAAQTYRAHMQKSNELEVLALNEQINQMEHGLSQQGNPSQGVTAVPGTGTDLSGEVISLIEHQRCMSEKFSVGEKLWSELARGQAEATAVQAEANELAAEANAIAAEANALHAAGYTPMEPEPEYAETMDDISRWLVEDDGPVDPMQRQAEEQLETMLAEEEVVTKAVADAVFLSPAKSFCESTPWQSYEGCEDVFIASPWEALPAQKNRRVKGDSQEDDGAQDLYSGVADQLVESLASMAVESVADRRGSERAGDLLSGRSDRLQGKAPPDDGQGDVLEDELTPRTHRGRQRRQLRAAKRTIAILQTDMSWLATQLTSAAAAVAELESLGTELAAAEKQLVGEPGPEPELAQDLDRDLE